LDIACEAGSEGTVEAIVRQGKVQSERLDALVMSAARHGDVEIAHFLQMAGANTCSITNQVHIDFIHLPVPPSLPPSHPILCTCVRACLFLLVHLSRLQNDRILHIAAREGNYEFVQAFLESHPSFPLTDWQNTNGHTAVIVACMNGQAEVAELLVRFGADLCLVDSNVCTERMLDQYIMTTCTWSANLHTHTHTLSLSLSLCLSALHCYSYS
jgi:hypothetical protein